MSAGPHIDTARLAELWFTEMTVAEIGFVLGDYEPLSITKAARRIGLPQRPRGRRKSKQSEGATP